LQSFHVHCNGRFHCLHKQWHGVGEQAQLSITRGEAGTGVHGGQEELPEALATPHLAKGRHGLPEDDFRFAV
jgi:hypothetical protein